MHRDHILPLELDRPLAFLDLEATGLDPARDRVVSLAVVKFAPAADPSRFRHFEPTGAPVRFCHRIDPGRPIPAAATAVHGLGDADVAGCPRFAAVARQLVRFLEDCDLAGYNLRRFDLPLLAQELGRAGVPMDWSGRRVVDVLELYCQLHPRDLSTAVLRYVGREHAGAHEALGDVLATAAVLAGMVSRHDELPRTVGGLSSRSGAVDPAGWLRRSGGRTELARGRHRGRTPEEVAATDPGYLAWLVRQPLLGEARGLLAAALGRRRPGGRG